MNDEKDVVEYRLQAIEKTLEEVKSVLIEDRMQSRDIAELQKTVAKFLNMYTEQAEKISMLQEHKTDIDELLEGLNAHDARIRLLEEKPNKDKAEKFTAITNTIFQIVLSAVMTMVLVKIGLK